MSISDSVARGEWCNCCLDSSRVHDLATRRDIIHGATTQQVTDTSLWIQTVHKGLLYKAEAIPVLPWVGQTMFKKSTKSLDNASGCSVAAKCPPVHEKDDEVVRESVTNVHFGMTTKMDMMTHRLGVR